MMIVVVDVVDACHPPPQKWRQCCHCQLSRPHCSVCPLPVATTWFATTHRQTVTSYRVDRRTQRVLTDRRVGCFVVAVRPGHARMPLRPLLMNDRSPWQRLRFAQAPIKISPAAVAAASGCNDNDDVVQRSSQTDVNNSGQLLHTAAGRPCSAERSLIYYAELQHDSAVLPGTRGTAGNTTQQLQHQRRRRRQNRRDAIQGSASCTTLQCGGQSMSC